MTKNQTPLNVIVTGDITVDWNILLINQSDETGEIWNPDDITRACPQRGGAALLADLVTELCARLNEKNALSTKIFQTGAVIKPDSPVDPQYHHSYALWDKYPADKSKKEKAIWRVRQFMGLDRAEREANAPPHTWQMVKKDPAEAQVVVLDDANLGFRTSPELWPACIRNPQNHQRPWVVLKMARPVAQGKLWDHLVKHFADRLITIVSVNDLRSKEVQISRELSWERTAQDVAHELVNNPAVNALSKCAHVIVLFKMAGAVLLSRQDFGAIRSQTTSLPRCSLFFDPSVVEGMWEQNYPGFMIGYSTCVAASIVAQAILSNDYPDVPLALQAGLTATRALHREGYEFTRIEGRDHLRFPFSSIASTLLKPDQPFAVAKVRYPTLGQSLPDESRKPVFWTILNDRYQDNLDQIAEKIVINGLKTALKGVPLGTFGDLETVDRREIESLRSIRALVSEYVNQPTQKTPLSIAVFGAPGSGKSFAIEQIARALSDQIEKMPEFNLSQFESVNQLIDAFQLIRDKSLSGRIPLVFWDEFDTNNLFWLRYFLAPMQDGKFQGQHPIGRCIFVFAGGTAYSMERFDRKNDEAFIKAKGPDFVSRLRGYVDILGVNRQRNAQGELLPDPYYILRRAILLRSILQRNARRIFSGPTANIDRGVLQAFLHVSEYKHGARSMTALVTTSMLAGKQKFERSCLPSEAQLNLHVNGQEFLKLVLQMDFERELIDRFAETVHNTFCAGLVSRGYRWGPVRDHQKKTHPLLMDYCYLPDYYKRQNLLSARSQINALSRLDCVVVVDDDQPLFTFREDELEWMAEQEHIRFVKERIAAGWRYGPVTNEAKKEHADLVHWREHTPQELAEMFTPEELAVIGPNYLPEAEKIKNRNLVSAIPGALKQAGYAIVRLPRRAVRIGVTGHRFLAEEERIANGIYQAVIKIEQEFPGEPLIVTSSLAEGTDRLVAQRIMARNQAKLVVVLPFARDEYRKDFKSRESKEVFDQLLNQALDVIELPGAETREAAYSEAGRFIVEHSDVLLAVWDGQSPQGAGGTGEVVALARKRGIPIAWVHAGNRRLGTEEATSLGVEQGTVSFEGFSD